MKKTSALLWCLACSAAISSTPAADFKQSKLTQVVNDVQIISAASQSQKTAAVNDVFTMPDILRTGAGSRAELVAADETVTRVGANTIFSFDPANRTVNLKQGSLLFHSPHGKGGGTIHTGSATASVLGSTLIVTTTESGGFKVLALEDEAEIKLPNGRKVKLHPGQMTFILPGGNQLSPIIIFRLDSLTASSLLVKGFGTPLPSLQLIQNEIDKQVKLIKSGKATDTGLFAGDDANANQVEVLDLNSIHNNYNSAKTALLADATINQSSLTDVSVPTPPNHVFISQLFVLENNSFFGSRNFNGFAAQNVYFNTPAVALTPLTVNLGAYGLPEFDFVAQNKLDFQGSVTFAGLSANQKLSLFGGQQILFASGITVRADCKDFQLAAPSALTLDGVQLKNAVGHLSLNFNGNVLAKNNAAFNAAGDLSIHSVGNVTLDHSTATAGSIFFSTLGGVLTLESSALTTAGNVIFSTANEITIKDSIINAGDMVIGGSSVSKVNINNSTIITASGTLLVSYANDFIIRDSSLESSDKIEVDAAAIDFGSTSVKTHLLTLNSGDGILLDATGKTLTGVGASSTATFTAPNLITVNHADFSSFALLNMTANTITLSDVTLAPISNFGTHTGQAYVNQTVVPGSLNLINCNWQNTAVTSASQINLTSGPGSTAGIYSYANGR